MIKHICDRCGGDNDIWAVAVDKNIDPNDVLNGFELCGDCRKALEKCIKDFMEWKKGT